QSYSLYLDRMEDWFSDYVAPDWNDKRGQAMLLLQEEAELDEIVRLVGVDALSFKDRLTLEVARMLREDYLHQNAFDEVDTYTSLNKQYRMLSLILAYQEKGQKTLERGAEFSKVIALKVRERIGRAKYIPEDELAQFDKIEAELSDQMSQLTEGEL
ncbi:MAG: V-type ATP synthase subunit A, partial [Clostridia bacterium]